MSKRIRSTSLTKKWVLLWPSILSINSEISFEENYLHKRSLFWHCIVGGWLYSKGEHELRSFCGHTRSRAGQRSFVAADQSSAACAPLSLLTPFEGNSSPNCARFVTHYLVLVIAALSFSLSSKTPILQENKSCQTIRKSEYSNWFDAPYKA